MLDATRLPPPPSTRERRAFTDRQLASLKPREKPYEVLDAARKGLMLRVLPTGTKTFYFRYQRQGKVERITVGQYPAVTLRQAYETHAELTLRLNRGQDPREGQLPGTAAAIAATTGPTVGELAEEFLKRYIQRERKRPEQAARAIEENILKYWRRRPVRSITRRDGILLLDKIVDRGAPVMANRVAALLAQMFRFGLNRGILDATPFVAMPLPGGSEKSRKRKLDEAEVRHDHPLKERFRGQSNLLRSSQRPS